MANSRCLIGGAVIVGLVLAIVGILCIIGFPIDSLVRKQILENDYLGYTTDENGTEILTNMTATWLKPQYKMQLNIWMFNVTNVDDVLHRHAKPNLQEIGPFVFDEKQEKVYHKFAANDTRVFYKNQKLYFFNKNASCEACHLNINVTIPNVVFQKLVDAAEDTIFGIRIRFAIESILKLVKEGPFITVSVNDALFNGYHDPIVDLVCKNQILSILCTSNIITKRVGFFYGQNGTTDGTYEVDTGKPSPFNIGKVYSWNNMSMMPEDVWDSPYARMINGSDGQVFSPMLQREKRLSVFVSQLCRSIQLEYVKDVAVAGVPSWRYTAPSDLYDPAIPANRDFCNKHGTPRYFDNTTIQIENCLPAGIIDLSRCQAGSPRVYLSQPHFYKSPKELWHAVSGLAVPSDANDNTYVDLEPNAGVPTQAKRTVQINVGMVKGSLSITENTTNVIVPVLWMNETAFFDDGTREQLSSIFGVKHYSFIGGVASLLVGVLTWLAVFVVIIAFSRQEPDEYGRLIFEDDDGEEGQQNLNDELVQPASEISAQ
ncbi:unnamed protein product [Caenorhabditis bovis]|uniref:Uncharacterized protein n=1 Tax=Caenorhabditis bovis TaxID=2654633 RepID=A0A8S1EKU9_9PELO|nr:unnamed protein product [Caenorhabditis bovis]